MIIIEAALYCICWGIFSTVSGLLVSLILVVGREGVVGIIGEPVFPGIFMVFLYGPAPYAILMFPFGLLHTLWLEWLERHRPNEEDVAVIRSIKIGAALGVVQLVGSVFVVHMSGDWKETIFLFGVSALLASMACGYVIGRLHSPGRSGEP